MNLYEISHQLETLIDNAMFIASENDGVIPEELATDIENLDLAKRDKIENIAMFVKNENAMIEAISEEQKNLANRKKQHQNKVSWLKGYLSNILQHEKYESVKAKITFRKSEKVEILDVDKLTEDFKIAKIAWSPRKSAIKEAIKRGQDVEGAILIKNNNITIK